MAAAGFGLLSADDVAEVLLRAAQEAEPGAVWGLRPDTGAFPALVPAASRRAG